MNEGKSQNKVIKNFRDPRFKMKKIMLTKSNSLNAIQKPPVLLDIVENTDNNMYLKRKAMQPAYQDLFRALFRLPDPQVQARIMDAINGRADKRKTIAEQIIQTCDKCKQQQTKQILVDVATQTTIFSNETMLNSFKDTTNKTNPTSSNSDDSRDTPPPTEIETKPIENELLGKDEPKVKKRKQRRKLRVPQVIKRSQAKLMQEQQQRPILQKRKALESKSNDDLVKRQDDVPSITKRQRSCSLSSVDLENALSETMLWDLQLDEKMIVMKIMTEEYREAEIIQSDGLIKIHSAIMENDLNCLKRQIYVWSKLKKVDLNELITEDGDDCLQLAVIQNKSFCFVDVLIENGLDVNSLDDQSNTLIHLAIFNNVDGDVLSLILRRIDLNMLHKLNDDGLTPLHLAIRQDTFVLAEIILNSLDERCFGHAFYKRDNCETKEMFLKYYEKCCERLHAESSMFKQSKEKQRLKRRLIDATEMRSGNTALLCAIENKLEHFIYLLLAHFADPRIENHSGQSPRTFLGEFGKLLNLSLKIDRVMEKIEIFLEKQ